MRARFTTQLVVLSLSAALFACEDARGPTPDATSMFVVSPPAAPEFGDCAEGFQLSDEGVGCSPIGGGSTAPCGPGASRFSDAPDCVRVGPECPADGWPAASSLGAGTIRYVDQAAAANGDGSKDRPFASITSALAESGARTLALRAGIYEGSVLLTDGMALVGACAGATVLRGPARTPATGAVVSAGIGTRLANVTLGGEGAGILIYEGSMDIENVVVDGTMVVGVMTLGAANVRASGLSIRNVRADTSADPYGYGIVIAGGSTADLTRLSVDTTAGTGIIISDEGTDATLRNILVARARTNSAGYGAGVRIELSAHAVFERLIVSESSGGMVVADDAVVRVHASWFGESADGGIVVQTRSAAELSQIVVTSVGPFGIAAVDSSSLVLRDGVIRNIRPSDVRPEFGQAFVVEASTATLERVELADHSDLAVAATNADLTLTDVMIRRTMSNPITGDFGRAINAVDQTELRASRLAIEHSRDLHIVVGRGSSFHGTDVLLRDVQERVCTGGACSGPNAGHAVFVTDSMLDLHRFVIEESAVVGIFFDSGTLRLEEGVVRGSVIGLNVRTGPYDPQAVVNVQFFENERNFARSDVPAPEVAVPSI